MALSPPSDSALRTDHLNSDLAKRTISGGLITLATQGARFFAQIGSTVVLARLLAPDDFGIVGMATALTGLAVMLNDLGLADATVQRSNVTHRDISTLFWINTAVGIALAAVLVASSPVVAWFFGTAAVMPVTIVLSSGVVLGGLTIQHRAVLRRQMRFIALAAIDTAYAMSSLLVGILMALAGYGHWALVGSSLFGALVHLVLVWICARWIPGRPAWGPGVRSMIAFGGNLTAFSFTNYAAKNADNLLIGWYWGPAVLGSYSKAYSLLLLPVRQLVAPLNPVAQSSLARLVDFPARYRRAYIRAVEKLLMVAMPLVGYMLITADWTVLVILGPQWETAIPVFRWLALFGLFQPLLDAIAWLFITQHRAGEFARWGCLSAALSITSFGIGLPWGATHVAAAYALSGICLQVPLLLWLAGRRGPITSADLRQVSYAGVIGAVATMLTTLTARGCFTISTPLLGLAVTAPLAAAGCIASYLLIPKTRLAVLDAYALGRPPRNAGCAIRASETRGRSNFALNPSLQVDQTASKLAEGCATEGQALSAKPFPAAAESL